MVCLTTMFCRAEQLMNYIEYEPKMWDNLGPNFMDHLDQVNADLKAASLPLLGITQEY